MILVSLLLLLLACPLTAAQKPEDCLACHADKIDSSKFTASTHGVLGCDGCHTGIKEYPHPAPFPATSAKPDCAACHSDPVAQHKKSIHAGVQKCSDCHGDIHAITPHTDQGAPTHFTHQAEACAKCHAERPRAPAPGAELRRVPLVRPVEAYLQSVHARAVAAGKRGAACADCHGNHNILPAADPRSSVHRARVADTCAACHKEIAEAFQKSVHGEVLARGRREAPTCTDCHGEHNIRKHTDPASPVFAANIPQETCGRCHSDTRLSAKFGLPADKVPAFQESFHGLALRSGKLTAANCASCHGVHDILPSSDPASHVSKQRLPETCGKCHPGAGERFALGPVHVVPTSRASSPAVYWIRLGYLWIIFLTIGGMTAHNLLDFARKFGQPQRLRPDPAEQPERMSRPLRWQHGLVVLSFPILVYTGFALKFPEAWWAAPMVHLETDFSVRGWLHRGAAVVLLIALVWHLVHLAVRRPLRACLRGMIPNYLDAVTLWAFLRNQPRPHQRFSYIEKAEYWAFLWGMVVMSLTGFLLWFQNWTLRNLPGGTADVATAIHYYEAILASLAILVWHFYWVIFDPEVYPMDTSFWNGKAVRLEEVVEPPSHRDTEPATEEPQVAQ